MPRFGGRDRGVRAVGMHDDHRRALVACRESVAGAARRVEVERREKREDLLAVKMAFSQRDRGDLEAAGFVDVVAPALAFTGSPIA